MKQHNRLLLSSIACLLSLLSPIAILGAPVRFLCEASENECRRANDGDIDQIVTILKNAQQDYPDIKERFLLPEAFEQFASFVAEKVPRLYVATHLGKIQGFVEATILNSDVDVEKEALLAKFNALEIDHSMKPMADEALDAYAKKGGVLKGLGWRFAPGLEETEQEGKRDLVRNITRGKFGLRPNTTQVFAYIGFNYSVPEKSNNFVGVSSAILSYLWKDLGDRIQKHFATSKKEYQSVVIMFVQMPTNYRLTKSIIDSITQAMIFFGTPAAAVWSTPATMPDSTKQKGAAAVFEAFAKL